MHRRLIRFYETESGALMDVLILISAWIFYFILHSVLASLITKQWVAKRWPHFMPAYRLGFNLVAILLLAPIFWLMHSHAWPSVWQWQGVAKLLANIVTVLAVIGFIWSLKYYDLQEFMGFRQWRAHVTQPEDQEHLQISPLHRFVRHPWYFFAIVILWSRDLDLAQFILSALGTLYFIIGSRMEEQKLLVYHGDRYRRYQQRVPGLFPLPWKFLSKADAKLLAK